MDVVVVVAGAVCVITIPAILWTHATSMQYAYIFWMQMLRGNRAFSVSMWLKCLAKGVKLCIKCVCTLPIKKWGNKQRCREKTTQSFSSIRSMANEIMNSSRVKHLNNKLHKIMWISSSCIPFEWCYIGIFMNIFNALFTRTIEKRKFRVFVADILDQCCDYTYKKRWKIIDDDLSAIEIQFV